MARKKMGRPTIFTVKLGDALVKSRKAGLSMRQCAKRHGIALQTLQAWLSTDDNEDLVDFSVRFGAARAKTEQEHLEKLAADSLGGDYRATETYLKRLDLRDEGNPELDVDDYDTSDID